MKSPAKIVIMSHLSDVQEMLSRLNEYHFANAINRKINFAKFIICMKGSNSLMKEIDPDKLYKEFCEKFPEEK